MLEVITFDDSRLRERSEPTSSSEVCDLVKRMFKTMYAKEGIGLAAVQVGRLLRVFITKVEGSRSYSPIHNEW